MKPSRTSSIAKASSAFIAASALFAALLLAPASPAQTAAAASAPTTSQWSPKFHFFDPPRWFNDPNGPILLDGKYNLYFQSNPFGDQWGHMSWGHAVSTDLVRWKVLPVSIPEDDGIMIFSGSTVSDKDNTSGLCGDSKSTPQCVMAIYAGHTPEKQTQNIAVSRDGGNTYTKYSGNPVIDLNLKDFRDPKVFWHAPTKSWVMVVAMPDIHKVRFYRSKNLRQWEQTGEFGPAGSTGGVWECPDLFELPIREIGGKHSAAARTTERRWVLSVNINPGGPQGGSADQYFVGQFDGAKFTEDHPGSGPHWADWGKDFYASTSFYGTPAGQDRIWLAWMSNWQYAGKLPTLPGRGEMTIARSLWLSEPANRNGLTPSQEPLLLVQEPIIPAPPAKPSEALFGGAPYRTIKQANERIVEKKIAGDSYVLRLTLDPGDAAEAGVRLRRSSADPQAAADEETIVGIDKLKGRIFVDRTHSGKVDWAPEFSGRVYAPLKHAQNNSIPLEIVVDRNSVEVFAENGETVLTELIYPSEASTGLSFYSTPTPPGSGPALVRGVDLSPLN